MSTLLRMVQSVDLSVYSLLSRLHGRWFFDRLASFQETNTLLKSGLFISMYWYFWFCGDKDNDAEQRERRGKILGIIAGTLAGLVLTRMLATVLPFRIRPMYDPSVMHRSMSIPMPSDFLSWSSFPSDHAACLCALGFGLICLSRRLTVPLVLFVAEWICLPRMYLGIHYASDILVGAAIGVAAVWASLRADGIRSTLTRPVLAFLDARPQVFYTVSFLVTFEMATLFWDTREPVRALLHAASTGHHHKIIVEGFVLSGFLFAVMVAAWYRLTSPDVQSADGPAPVAEPAPAKAMAAKSGA